MRPALLPALLPPLAIVLLAAPAHALDEAEGARIREVISSQMAAFRRNDGAGAFAFASPGIQGQFTSPEAFLAMVERGYAPIRRGEVAEFSGLAEQGGRIVQVVRVRDASGEVWVAHYLMEKTGDAWRVAGCWLVREPGVSA